MRSYTCVLSAYCNETEQITKHCFWRIKHTWEPMWEGFSGLVAEPPPCGPLCTRGLRVAGIQIRSACPPAQQCGTLSSKAWATLGATYSDFLTPISTQNLSKNLTSPQAKALGVCIVLFCLFSLSYFPPSLCHFLHTVDKHVGGLQDFFFRLLFTFH